MMSITDAADRSPGTETLELVERRYGADPLRANTSGQTPVGMARLIGNYDVARFFDDVAL